MGYCMNQQYSEFFIPADKVNDTLKAVQALAGKETIHDVYSHFSWVSEDFHLATSFAEIMRAWRWHISYDADGNVDEIEFNGEKFGDDIILFKAIAPFVKEGSFIEMQGEDGALWRWYFDGNKCIEKDAKISWE